jgi:sulfur dioxygenase
MLFRQFFDRTSSTFTYLLASRPGGEALIIDPVKEQVSNYTQVINELRLRLVHAIDTHTHADHVTALGDLRDTTACTTVMGDLSKAHCVSRHVGDGELIEADGVRLRALYTPGHTDESYSFVLEEGDSPAVFTGDVLLIRSSGRTDFQSGDPRRSWDSIVNRLFRLPDDTTVYPAHDYKGWTSSSIGEEKRFNPRIAGKSQTEYVRIMRSLNLPHPAMMDVAIPANLACGQPDLLLND